MIDGEKKNIWRIKTEELSRKHQLRFALVREIYKLCKEGFHQAGDQDFKRDVINHVMNEEKICLVFENKMSSLTASNVKQNPLVAFVSYRTVDGEMIYLSGVVTAPPHQGKGVASEMIRWSAKMEDVKWFAARTQNPAMRESLKRVCDQISPPLSGERPPENHMSRGERIARMLGMSRYDRTAMIEKGTYGKSLYGEEVCPTLDNDIVLNAAFRRIVKVENGDSMIVIGRRGE